MEFKHLAKRMSTWEKKKQLSYICTYTSVQKFNYIYVYYLITVLKLSLVYGVVSTKRNC